MRPGGEQRSAETWASSVGDSMAALCLRPENLNEEFKDNGLTWLTNW